MHKSQKTIIFGMPKRYGFYQLMIRHMEALGYKVIDVCFEDEKFSYKSLGERLTNLYKKTIRGDRSYKNLLKVKHQKEKLIDPVAALKEKADYALFIRPDLYHPSYFELIRKKANKLIAYQWDGLVRFPHVIPLIPIFDKFYVFDQEDTAQKGVSKWVTNFYFETPNEQPPKQLYDLYYIGVYVENRMEDILLLLGELNAHDLNARVDLLIHHDFQIPSALAEVKGLHFITEAKSYEETLALSLTSKLLIDFVNKEHKGLSFRCFEALYFEKKIITTNPTIKNYDFYNPQNVFILGEDSIDRLKDFVTSEYVEVPEDIKAYYAFSNWMERNIVNA